VVIKTDDRRVEDRRSKIEDGPSPSSIFDLRSSINSSRFSVLSLLGCGSALLYTLLLLRFPLDVIYNCPRTNLDKLTRVEATPQGLPLTSYICPHVDLDNLTRPDTLTGLALFVGVLLLFGAYALGALALVGPNAVARTAPRRTSWPLGLALVGFPLLFAALLLLVYPVTSVDLYDYVFRGRMLVHYTANTFIQVPQDFRSDPLFDYVAWRRAVTAYGPLWEGLSWLTGRLAGETPGGLGGIAPRDADLLRLMLAYKALGTLGFLLCGAAIWGALGRIAPERRALGLYFWLWNPLALWETVAAGHNDAWMALFIVLAVWAFSAGAKMPTRQGDKLPSGAPGTSVTLSPAHLVSSSLAAFLALTAGGLIKFLSLFLGPVLLAAALRRRPSWRARGRLMLLVGAVCLAAAALAYAPFWAGWETFRNFGDRTTLFTATWLATLQAGLAAHGVEKALAQQIATMIGLGLLLVGVLWATWRAWSAPERVAEHMLWLLLWFLFCCNPWFQPWYLLWPLALVALQPWRARAMLIVGVFCCTAMLSCYVAWSFLRPLLGWDVESARWNALLCVLIYTPLLVLVARWHAGERLRRWAGRLAPQGGRRPAAQPD
jgi:hypothetical protein